MTDLEQKRKERRKTTAEFFTPPDLVNYMLDKLDPEMWDEDKTFCDPSAGNGNFLVEILKRKLSLGHNPEKALSTIYGVELMADNVEEMKTRLLDIIGHEQKYIDIINKNIICHDALTFDWENFQSTHKVKNNLF